MHKSGESTKQCATIQAAKSKQGIRYDKEDSGQQGEKLHIKVV